MATKTKNARAMKPIPQRRNQSDSGAAAGYTDFHGRAPSELLELQQEHVKAGDYFALGDMCGLWLYDPGGEDPSRWYSPTIEFLERDKVKLAADEKGKQLYFIGGVQKIDEGELRRLAGVALDARYVSLGDCHAIAYRTEKSFDGFQTHEYGHRFGEETGERPQLYYDRQSDKLALVGGAYTIAPLDKNLGASPGIVN